MYKMRAAVLLTLTPLFMVGCIFSKTYNPTILYTLNPMVNAAKTSKIAKVVGIRPLETNRLYKQQIVYREPNSIVGSYKNAEWSEPPRDVVTRVLTDALVASGRFADVGDAADIKGPDWILTGQLRKFDEVRETSPWTAECEVRLELRETESSALVWAATLSGREPLEHDNVKALANAMDKALAKIVEEAVTQITAR